MSHTDVSNGYNSASADERVTNFCFEDLEKKQAVLFSPREYHIPE